MCCNSSAKSDPNAFKVVESKDTRSQTLAKLVTGGVLSAVTLKQFSGAGEDLEVSDLVAEMKKAGDEAVAGDFGWNPDRSRNVVVDIRYVLWVVESVFPSPRLLKELGC